jgi:hypothetical protein
MPGAIICKVYRSPSNGPNNCEVWIQGPEPFASRIATLTEATSTNLPVVNGLQLDTWYDLYAGVPADASGNYTVLISTIAYTGGFPVPGSACCSNISFTQVQNVVYNVEHGGVGWRPEIMIGSDIYTDNMYVDNNSTDLNKLQIPTNTDPIHIFLAAGALVHEACYVDQVQDGRSSNMSANEVENECMAAGGDDFYEKLGAPQWMIDALQAALDRPKQPR